MRCAHTLHVGGVVCSKVIRSRVRRTSCLSRVNDPRVESVMRLSERWWSCDEVQDLSVIVGGQFGDVVRSKCRYALRCEGGQGISTF